MIFYQVFDCLYYLLWGFAPAVYKPTIYLRLSQVRLINRLKQA